jgi:hypothetical protein
VPSPKGIAYSQLLFFLQMEMQSSGSMLGAASLQYEYGAGSMTAELM